MASSIWDLSTIQTNLALWIAADAAVAKNQSYSIEGRIYTRADAAVVSEKLSFWSSMEASALRDANDESTVSVRQANFNHSN